jgi:cell division septation protein DedD
LFFVVVALCGVFFAMGYMIGRNGMKVAVADDAPSPAGSAIAQRQQPEPPPAPDASPAPAPAQSDAGSTPPVAAPEVQTKPAQDSAPPVTAAPVLEAGASYLQIAALQQRADADSLIRTLREKELPAIVAQNPKDQLFRVLVGPYRQTAQVAEAKEKLKTLGFANAFVQKQ